MSPSLPLPPTDERIEQVLEYYGPLGGNPEAGGSASFSARMEEGYQIVTNRQTITLAIDADGQCCETFGYLLSEDEFEKFIGAELRGISLTDSELNSVQLERELASQSFSDGPDSVELMFVNIETDRGVLQFVAYNGHNGYYGHQARVSSQQLTHSEKL